MPSLATRAKAFLTGLVPFRGTGLPWIGDRIQAGGAMFNSVSNEHALGLTACYRACSIYSDAVSTQAPAIWENEATGGRKQILGTSAAWALATLPQADAELAAFHTCFYGNGYLKIIRDGTGAPYELRAVPTTRVLVELDRAGGVFYRIAADDALGEKEDLLAEADMIHFRFRTMGSNRLQGISPIATCSPAFAHALKAREAQAAVFRNLSYVSGVLQTPQKVDPKISNDLQTKWEQNYSEGGTGRTAILSNGLEWKPFTLKAVDAQLLEAIKVTDLDVARAYGLPFQFLSAGEGLTYASSSEGTRSLIVQSLRPFAARMADAFAQKLLTRNQRARGMKVEYDLTSLLLPPGKEQAEYVSMLVNASIITANEARNTYLGLPDIDGGDGLNSARTPAKTPAQKIAEMAEKEAAKQRQEDQHDAYMASQARSAASAAASAAQSAIEEERQAAEHAARMDQHARSAAEDQRQVEAHAQLIADRAAAATRQAAEDARHQDDMERQRLMDEAYLRDMEERAHLRASLLPGGEPLQ